ncbi:hypothetical protein STSP2_00512 [Anaerohalosphaera lusitana]|uniref:Uncharacterized protein n=2 Tax=Anaerohalosphaera lusitana TaxID=1936003 RepID=A0A1U9NHZ3_9BACT|nr:hypothetical protein STSP2_00512 [Anaerohalosphaera lusitana]
MYKNLVNNKLAKQVLFWAGFVGVWFVYAFFMDAVVGRPLDRGDTAIAMRRFTGVVLAGMLAYLVWVYKTWQRDRFWRFDVAGMMLVCGLFGVGIFYKTEMMTVLGFISFFVLSDFRFIRELKRDRHLAGSKNIRERVGYWITVVNTVLIALMIIMLSAVGFVMLVYVLGMGK